MMTDATGTLARIDPATNTVVAEVYVAPGSFAVAFGEGAVWITSTEKGVLTRVNPHNNVIDETIPVGPRPRFLAVGEGSVWTVNQGDGTISRVDAKTNKVVATIAAGIPGPGGEISVGEGSVWVTSFEYPITRIDPSTNKVAQQFYGEGGDAIRVGHGSVWLSNLRQANVWRLDPKRILATLPE
jgi:YVTN family beta-propeller protein